MINLSQRTSEEDNEMTSERKAYTKKAIEFTDVLNEETNK